MSAAAWNNEIELFDFEDFSKHSILEQSGSVTETSSEGKNGLHLDPKFTALGEIMYKANTSSSHRGLNFKTWDNEAIPLKAYFMNH